MMRLRVLGASGVAGRAFVPLAQAAGHEVLAERIDLLDAVALRRALRGADAVVNLATAIPRPGGRRDWALNDRLRREGTAHLVAACADSGVRCLVQQSVAMLHNVADARPQHEDDPIDGPASTTLRRLAGTHARTRRQARLRCAVGRGVARAACHARTLARRRPHNHGALVEILEALLQSGK